MREIPRRPRSDRGRLRFTDAVLEEFAFLLELGFRLTKADDAVVTYESHRRFVQVSHEPGDYGLSVVIGRWIDVDRGRREQRFPLGDIIGFRQDPDDPGYRVMSGTTASEVRTFVRQLSDWTRKFGWPLLTDGDEIFDELTARTTARGVAERAEQRASLLRIRADEAWQLRDLATVVDAYSEIDTDLPTVELSASERGRLNYALKSLDESE